VENVKRGTYFSQPLFEGLGDPFAKCEIDAGGERTDQGCLIAKLARAIMFFEADNKDLGLVCFFSTGMTEDSNYEITVKEGQHVNKRDEIGMFHYGSKVSGAGRVPGYERYREQCASAIKASRGGEEEQRGKARKSR
jgi:hypothetical protein